jgi:hypothetical protein
MLDRSLKRLSKRSRRGFRGYPLATLAAYGPDDRRASKLVVTVFVREGEEGEMRKWLSATADARFDPKIAGEVLDFLEQYDVLSVAMPDRIIGCPHEQGIDYEGEYCPACPFWIGRDRFTGKLVLPRAR